MVFNIVEVIPADHGPDTIDRALNEAFLDYPGCDGVRIRDGGVLHAAIDRDGYELAPEIEQRIVATHNRNHDLSAFLPAFAY